MSTAATTTGSTTTAAAEGASAQGPQPSTAAPANAPPANIKPAGPSGKKNYAPKSNIVPSSNGPSGLSQMLAAVSNFTMAANPELRVENYAIPNCTVLFQVIGMCDTQMSHTKRFTDANPDWHPYVTQLYFSILIYYHVLKTQKAGNQIDHDQHLFLEYLEDQFNIAHAKIPGPLVPFFQALAACSGPSDLYNNVTYGIPSNLGVDQLNHYLATNNINQHIPSVIHILDQFCRLINRLVPVNAQPPAATLAATDSHFMNILGVNATANAANEIVLKACNMRVDINASLSVMQGLINSANMWRSILPFDPVTNQSIYTTGNSQYVLSFSQYLGFNGSTATTTRTRYNWFREVGRIMQTYADFFKDSTSLGSVNTSGIGSIYIEAIFANSDENAAMLTEAAATRDVRYQNAGTERYVVPNLTDLEIGFLTKEDGLDLIAQQIGTLTAYNTTWPVNNNANTIHPGPVDGISQTGPVWDRPILRLTTGNMTPLRYYSNLISGYYHTPTAGKFGN
jgi:hypothetical protein